MEKTAKSLKPWIFRYWKLYGGWKAFGSSAYLYLATLLAIPCYPLWAQSDNSDWADLSVAILPSLMGFSVAGMAIVLAFSHPSSLRAVTQKGREDSYFLKSIANLLHFLFAQVLALVVALVAKSVHFWVLSYFGVLLLLYALLVSLAAAGQLFNTAHIMNKAVELDEKRNS